MLTIRKTMMVSHQYYCLSTDTLPWHCGSSLTTTCLQWALTIIIPLTLHSAYRDYQSYQAICSDKQAIIAIIQNRLQAHLQQRETDLPRMQRLLEMAQQQLGSTAFPLGSQPQ
jgi:hypothetical protein